MLGFVSKFELDREINEARIEIDRQIRQAVSLNDNLNQAAHRDLRSTDADLRLSLAEYRLGVEDVLKSLSDRIRVLESTQEMTTESLAVQIEINEQVFERIDNVNQAGRLTTEAAKIILDSVQELEARLNAITGGYQGTSEGGPVHTGVPTEEATETPPGPVTPAPGDNGTLTIRGGEDSKEHVVIESEEAAREFGRPQGWRPQGDPSA